MIAPWAAEEMFGSDLGDQRLDTRLVRVLSALGRRPNLSIPAACGGRAETEATYRFFQNDKVTFSNVLDPHIEHARQRVADQPVALLVQDLTEMDLTRPESEVAGVGDLDGVRRGFLLHVMQAFTPEGIPLGTVWADILNRTEGVSHDDAQEKAKRRKHTPIEEKESFHWLKGMRQARALAQQTPRTPCVYVADSEADIYEMFSEPRGETPLDWLIRAGQDRALEGDTMDHLRDPVLITPALYEVDLRVRGRRAKTRAETRGRRQDRVARTARVEVRAAPVTLRPPWRSDRTLRPVPVHVVVVTEVDPPAGEEPIEWILLTTLPIDDPDPVRRVVEYYCVRWQIEVFFRTLKSGCRIERRRFEHVDRVQPCLGVCLVVAWRTLFVCHMGRECPEVDCELIFEPSEWKAVWMAVRGTEPPETPPPLSVVVHMVAGLGGYIERPHSEPGAQTIWVGVQRMHDLAWAWDRFGPGARGRTQ